MWDLTRRQAALGLTATVASFGILVSAADAQTAEVAGPPDQNLSDFDFMVEKVTANYAGWDLKVTDATRPALTALTTRLRAEAATATPAQLLTVMRQWTDYFGDGHLRVNPISAPGTGQTGDGPAATPRLDWTEDSIRQQLRALGRRRDRVEGFWRIGGGRYRVGVLRTGATPTAFAAVVVETSAQAWSTGQVKAELTRQPDGSFAILYRSGDHSVSTYSGVLLAEDAVLRLSDDFGSWTREWPAPRNPDLADRLYPSNALFARRLSPTTNWLRIPSFSDDQAEPLRALLTEQASALATTANLIIDIRDNGGGSDYVYGPIIPLLYTQPIYTIGIEMRATADNIALRRQIIPQIVNSPDSVAAVERQIALMEQNIGGFIRPNELPFSIDRYPEVAAYPRRVAVLIDNAGSTAEQFLLEARQSRKVTFFGRRNSAGVLDFANVVGMPTPSNRFSVQWATSRSLRLPNDPVDPDGIAPDIAIPETAEDPVGFAQAWLERQRN